MRRLERARITASCPPRNASRGLYIAAHIGRYSPALVSGAIQTLARHALAWARSGSEAPRSSTEALGVAFGGTPMHLQRRSSARLRLAVSPPMLMGFSTAPLAHANGRALFALPAHARDLKARRHARDRASLASASGFWSGPWTAELVVAMQSSAMDTSDSVTCRSRLPLRPPVPVCARCERTDVGALRASPTTNEVSFQNEATWADWLRR